MAAPGYADTPWPAEDAGPQRLAAPWRGAGPGLRPGEVLDCRMRRIRMSTMPVLGAPGDLFLLSHEMVRNHLLGLPTTSRLHRLDPVTLETLDRSPPLAGGPAWPGGIAVHRNGSVHLVYGRWAWRLDRTCRPLASRELPVNRPYNSFVVLDDGTLVTKDLSRTAPSRLTALDPETLEPAGPDVECPEPTVARLSAIGNTVYVVGVRSIFRYRWEPSPAGRGRLVRDADWCFDYVGDSGRTWGWDVVLDGTDAWFMDNGDHRYVVSMIGAGRSPTANRLVRVSLADAADHDLVEVSRLPGGSITNPPVIDVRRRIAVGFDSANRVLRAWRIAPGTRVLDPLWEIGDIGVASHMILWPDTGELATNDYRRRREEVIVLDVETGAERGRARHGGIYQGVVFPCPGFGRDFYWATLAGISRIFVRGNGAADAPLRSP